MHYALIRHVRDSTDCATLGTLSLRQDGKGDVWVVCGLDIGNCCGSTVLVLVLFNLHGRF